jgi:hypothetical protein
MNDVTTFRLYLMRAAYLLIAVGLGITIWPGLIRHAMEGVPVHGATGSLLGAVAVLAAVGIRYPLQLLPLLLVESEVCAEGTKRLAGRCHVRLGSGPSSLDADTADWFLMGEWRTQPDTMIPLTAHPNALIRYVWNAEGLESQADNNGSWLPNYQHHLQRSACTIEARDSLKWMRCAPHSAIPRSSSLRSSSAAPTARAPSPR